MEFEFVEKLIRSMDASSIDSIEIERGGTRIRLAKTPPGAASAPMNSAPVVQPVATPGAALVPPVAPAGASGSEPGSGAAGRGSEEAASSNPGWVDVTSPMVGTFYRSPSPEAPAFVEPGSRITRGDPLCIIEAMKLMNELEAEVEGTVREVLVQNGEPVEYGQVLFRVESA
ncbi:MAG: acetyl-CoA carboxylase biotin carboxyl carrier protein [Gemmatimonadales bacterium]|nr:MAG: acetyl-CoA carboxylase biotin carboxyl carrier protein [Gemmatimonadales bacterium]